MLNMCQISSLMAAAEGYVAEFSRFANFEEKKRKSNLLMPFPKTGSQMGSFGQIRKNSFFRFCRPILDIFGFTLLKHLKHLFLLRINSSLWSTVGRIFHKSEGWGPSQNVQPFFAFSFPRAPKNKAPAVENLELKGRFGTDTSLSDYSRLLFSLVSTSC